MANIIKSNFLRPVLKVANVEDETIDSGNKLQTEMIE